MNFYEANKNNNNISTRINLDEIEVIKRLKNYYEDEEIKEMMYHVNFGFNVFTDCINNVAIFKMLNHSYAIVAIPKTHMKLIEP